MDARHRELLRRARARAAMGRGGEATRRRAGLTELPPPSENPRTLRPSGEGKRVDPNAATPADPVAPAGQTPVLRSQTSADLVSQGITPPRLDDEDVSARREGNFLRALMRVRQNPQAEVGEGTRRRLQGGAGAGGYDESGEFAPQGFTVDSARGLTEDQFNALLNRFREKRSKIKSTAPQYDL